MLKRYRHFFVGLMAVLLALAIVNIDLQSRPGFTGRTLKPGSSNPGCSCHGNQTASVVLSGPSSLTVGQSGSYTLTLGSSNKTGLNVAASDGNLAPVSPSMSLSNSELTSSSSRNAATWNFTYTPTNAGSKTLYAAGITNGINGPWNHATNYSITATDPVSSVEGNSTPNTFELEQNFPNPFNPSTTIRYSIATASVVTLEVFAITGERIATLVNQAQDPGRYQVQFVDPGMSSGIYIYRLEARSTDGNSPGFVATRKLALLK